MRKRRSWRNYLLNYKLQLRYTAIMVAISAVLTVGLGYVWYGQVRETSKVIEVQALGTMTEVQVERLDDEIRRQDTQRLLVLVAFGVLLAVALAAYGIVLTHKVAGPLFKMARYMAAVKDGNLGPIGDIRKGDHLHEFFDAYREMHQALRERSEREGTLLGEAIRLVERYVTRTKGEEPEELARAVEKLRALRDQKDDDLGTDYPVAD
jgi:hypothetical protein